MRPNDSNQTESIWHFDDRRSRCWSQKYNNSIKNVAISDICAECFNVCEVDKEKVT